MLVVPSFLLNDMVAAENSTLDILSGCKYAILTLMILVVSGGSGMFCGGNSIPLTKAGAGVATRATFNVPCFPSLPTLNSSAPDEGRLSLYGNVMRSEEEFREEITTVMSEARMSCPATVAWISLDSYGKLNLAIFLSVTKSSKSSSAYIVAGKKSITMASPIMLGMYSNLNVASLLDPPINTPISIVANSSIDKNAGVSNVIWAFPFCIVDVGL
mmetsp:Transcript_81580/g.132234  ORF Transcript_81580/g.132234 Transcript_81580/m.132234 type:complete len:215 (-) Transcript_81580:423-1067(-)